VPVNTEDAEGARRVTMPEAIGPILVEGPVEVLLPDGSVHRSGRPVVALCACRRSRHYPFCDTSHRRRSAGAPGSSGGEPADKKDG
jgi:CDGSH-type Zn-finger protein